MDSNISKKENEETQMGNKKPLSHSLPENLAGQIVGDYKFIKEIGRGGMAIIYEARQISLDRDVAIKIIPQSLVEDPEYMERFKREASSAASLNHQNIVSIHGFGQFGATYYYVMDLAKGKTLDKIIEEKKHELFKKARVFNVDEALKIIEQTASALAYAHKHGIVHRDIKPSNIMLDEETGRILITDFGLAKSTRWEKITPSASLFGTPAYMSPEQASGKDVDHRSDIYSLGAVFYELLTGRLPYEGDNALAIIDKVKTDPITAPRNLNPSIPIGIEYMILKAMSRSLKLRYNSMRDFLTDIASFKEGKSVNAFMKIAQKKTGVKLKNKKVIYIISVFIAVLTVIITGFIIMRDFKKREETRNIDSKLQLAENYGRIGMKDEAIKVYQEIMEKYPKTKYARIAEEKLFKYK